MALTSDGTVWADYVSQYGSLSGVTAIAGGVDHNSVLKEDGTVWGWGYNLYGDLGNGSNLDSSIPVQVSGLTGAVAIGVGYYHSLAVLSGSTPELTVAPGSLTFEANACHIGTADHGRGSRMS